METRTPHPSLSPTRPDNDIFHLYTNPNKLVPLLPTFPREKHSPRKNRPQIISRPRDKVTGVTIAQTNLFQQNNFRES